MDFVVLVAIFIALLCVTPTIHSARKKTNFGVNNNEDEAKLFLERFNKELSALSTEVTIADWNYVTNLTDHNAAILDEVRVRYSAYTNTSYQLASSFNTSGFSYDTVRLLENVGSPSLSPEAEKQLSNVLNEMGRIYGSHKVCKTVGDGDADGTCYSFEPDLKDIMMTSTNDKERLWAWQQWHDGVGRLMHPLYQNYVKWKNEAAVLDGYDDYGDKWRQKYETDELQSIVEQLYKEMDPLYRQLHAYIRRRLYNAYGPDVIDLKGPLPAHLLGDMWGRFWSGLNDIAQPYPGKTSVDPTPALQKQNYTVRKMFEMGNDFFVSMGLQPVPETFFNLSLLEKPIDREVMCHATAWEFSDGKDFRIRMCSKINFDDFLTVHHELGHIQYFMQYAHQPIGYRDGANDGFHEAIGELMSMSVATTKHLHSIGLMQQVENDREVEINFLMQQALSSVSTLPFHLVMDTWRWKLFAGQIPDAKQWNAEFWKEKARVVGVVPPIDRPDDVLDAAALYHIANDYDMIRYFMRTVIQFQFAEALCNAAGHIGPLHQCDIYQSKEAGTALARMLKMGSSRPWPDAMEALTGQRNISARALLNYFEPLRIWLENENTRNKEFVGWNVKPMIDNNVIPSSTSSSLNLVPLSFTLPVSFGIYLVTAQFVKFIY